MRIQTCLGWLLATLFALNALAQAPINGAAGTKSPQSPAYAVGHRNPDLDSVAAAIALAELMTRRGLPCLPAVQGKLAPDSTHALAKFGLDTPERITEASGHRLLLVDHSDPLQSLNRLDEGEILAIVDHHALGGLATRKPPEIWVWPVGSTCTVVAGMYHFYGLEIPKGIAGLMLSAILADTALFKSSTTTELDRRTAADLAQIEGIPDLQALGRELFRAMAELDGVPARELLLRDYKDYRMGGLKVGIAQLEVMGKTLVDPHRARLRGAMVRLKAEKGLDALFLMLTDLDAEGSELLFTQEEAGLAQKAFGLAARDGRLWLPGLMSRKKDVVPRLERAQVP